MKEIVSKATQRRRVAYARGVEAGRRAGTIEILQKLAAVATATGHQSAEPATEIAGLLVSGLAGRPEIVARFLREGVELFFDGTLTPVLQGRAGALSYRAGNGSIVMPLAPETATETEATEHSQ